MDLNTFLAWFGGYSENIKQKPTAAQWKRIVDEIKNIQPLAPVIVQAAAPATAAVPPPPARPSTPTAWKAAVQAALIENGCDDETASELIAEVTVDLTQDPAAVATAEMAKMMN
jgi:hypothetical protein